MGLIRKPEPVKLIMGMIANDVELFEKVEAMLERKFGKIDFKSHIIDFNFTNYYEKEMGKGLKRKFISFEKLILPSEIVRVKLYTNKIERKFSDKGKRNVNLDPGYLNEGKVVLASTKDNLQRIYLGKGIYAEVTLYYRNKNFEHFNWTYPDYRTDLYKGIFKEMRRIFRRQIGKE